MEFKIIEYGTQEHEQMLDLRYRILREPLNNVPTEAELAEDIKYLLLGAFLLDGGGIVACCFLSCIDKETVRLRQMAVDTFSQGQGLGRELIKYAESIARKRGCQYIYLHARKNALGFYKKQGYTIESDEFIEVGIPHYEMKKNLDSTI